MQTLNINRRKQSIYGFNVEGFNAEAKRIIERILKKYRPSTVVYNNDYSGAQKLYDITEGESLIIHRTYQPNNVESSWENWTANNWKEFYKARTPGPIYQTFLNNPVVREDQIDSYIEFILEVLRWATDNNYRLTFPLPDCNVPWETLIDKGAYDKLLLAYDDYGFREFGHVGAIKEQIPFHLNLSTALSRKRDGLENLSAQTLLKYEFMQKSYWPTYEEVNITNWMSNEYLYRSVWINKRLGQLGRKAIPVVVTEFNWGDNATFSKWTDSNNITRNIQKEITDLYKISPSPYPFFSGIMSLKPLYENLFKLEDKTSETFEESVFSQIQHIQKISPDNYLGLCWYTLDPGSALRDLRAGLSYQALLETLEPLLYSMSEKLKEDKVVDPDQVTAIPVVNIVSTISTTDTKPAIKSVDTVKNIEPISTEPVVTTNSIEKTSDNTGSTAPTVNTTPITHTVPTIPTLPTVVIEGPKLEDKRSSQITLKVDEKTGKVENKEVKTADSDLPINEWRVYWVSSVGLRSNIRSQANVKSDAIGKIEEEETLYYVGKQLLQIDNLGYRWVPISDYNNEKKSIVDIKGWVREDAVKLRRYEFLYNFPVSIVVTVNNASAEEVEWIKRKLNSGDIKVEIKVD